MILKENKARIENMSNLDLLPPTGAMVIIGTITVEDDSQVQASMMMKNIGNTDN